MTSSKLLLALSMLCGLSLSGCNHLQSDDTRRLFIEKMVKTHAFEPDSLQELLTDREANQQIIEKMNKPAEAMPWHRYRKIFLTETRINDGVKFWKDNAAVLADVEKRYRVPAQIIVAIIGVETRYGRFTGNYSVIDALTTLAFFYPARSAFFQSELENYLLLCREEQINPVALTGSYAGAMGMPQFMPSSYNRYAQDYNHDGHRDIWHNPADAIASVANYFVKHGWQPDAGIAYPIYALGNDYRKALSSDLKPDLRLSELESLNLKITSPLALDTKVKLLAFQQETGEELWVGLDNFYCLTRYNHSALYAMAVYQLSQSILVAKGLNVM